MHAILQNALIFFFPFSSSPNVIRARPCPSKDYLSLLSREAALRVRAAKQRRLPLEKAALEAALAESQQALAAQTAERAQAEARASAAAKELKAVLDAGTSGGGGGGGNGGGGGDGGGLSEGHRALLSRQVLSFSLSQTVFLFFFLFSILFSPNILPHVCFFFLIR